MSPRWVLPSLKLENVMVGVVSGLGEDLPKEKYGKQERMSVQVSVCVCGGFWARLIIQNGGGNGSPL